MKKETARFAFLQKSDKSTNLHPRPLHRRTAPGSSGLSGRGRSQFRLTQKKTAGDCSPAAAPACLYGLIRFNACKRKTSVTLFFVRHSCAAAHKVCRHRFYLFHAQFLGFVSSSSVRGAFSFLKVVKVSSAHPLISPSGASSNQAFIIALIHSNFFPSYCFREKAAPRGILSKYL